MYVNIIYLSSDKLVASFLVDAAAGVPTSPSLAVRIHRHGGLTGSTHQEPLRCAQKPNFFNKWVFDACIQSGSEPGRKALQTRQDSWVRHLAKILHRGSTIRRREGKKVTCC